MIIKHLKTINILIIIIISLVTKKLQQLHLFYDHNTSETIKKLIIMIISVVAELDKFYNTKKFCSKNKKQKLKKFFGLWNFCNYTYDHNYKNIFIFII